MNAKIKLFRISSYRLRYFILFLASISCFNGSFKKDQNLEAQKKFYEDYKISFGRDYYDHNYIIEDETIRTYKPISCAGKPRLCKLHDYLNVSFPDEEINFLFNIGAYKDFIDKKTTNSSYLFIDDNTSVLKYNTDLFPYFILEKPIPKTKYGEKILKDDFGYFKKDGDPIEEYEPSNFPDFNPRIQFDDSISIGERERLKKVLIFIKIILQTDQFKSAYKKDRNTVLINVGGIDVELVYRPMIYSKAVNYAFNYEIKVKREKEEEFYRSIHEFNKKYPSFYSERNNPTFMVEFKELFANYKELALYKDEEQKECEITVNSDGKFYNPCVLLEELASISKFIDLYGKDSIQDTTKIPLYDTYGEEILDLLRNFNDLIVIKKAKKGYPLIHVENFTTYHFHYNGKLLNPYSSIFRLPSYLFHAFLHSIGYQHPKYLYSKQQVIGLFDNLERLFMDVYYSNLVPKIPYECYQGNSEEWNNC